MKPHDLTPRAMNMARSQPPAISPQMISRKHLFSLFETSVPGSTLVVAPAGFGKTTLVAEWVKENKRPTFWYTADDSDSIRDFQDHVVAAVSSYFPDFLKGIMDLERIDPAEGIKVLGSAISQLPGEFNLVIDTGRIENQEIAFSDLQLIADNVPDNSHLIVIRRNSPLTSFARYATLGSLSRITSADLKFSPSEVSAVASINDVDLTLDGNSKEIDLCQGWPAAVQLMCRNIAKGNSHITFSQAVESNVNPLGILALETFNMFSLSTREKLLKLSIVEEFDEEIAQVILGEDFSLAFLNRIASDGIFVTASTTAKRTYRFNPIIYETLKQIPKTKEINFQAVAKELTEIFLVRGDITQALKISLASGDRDRFTEIFRQGLREMAATGRGDLLIKWAHFAGDDSAHGEILKKAIRIFGHLVQGDFQIAEALTVELEQIVGLGPDGEFINRLAGIVKAHIYFARGDFERSSLFCEVGLSPMMSENSFDSNDMAALFRLQARRAFLYDDFEELTNAYLNIKSLPIDGNHEQISFHLVCVKSMLLYSEGRYLQAAEIARVAVTKGSEAGYTGITGALDAMMVLARTQLEASELESCIETLNTLMKQAKEWQIWPWFFMAEGTFIRIQINAGLYGAASEAIAKQRAFLSTLEGPNQLSWLIDMSEISLSVSNSDWRRAEELANRMPQIDLVRQIKAIIAYQREPKKVSASITGLPENTVRERINKLLAEVSVNLDHENLALKSLNKALDLGAENGYHEYFIRQSAMYSLIVKAAAARPTIYLEGLVQAMTQRLQGISDGAGELDEKLTGRELEILKHLSTGNTISSIAKTLHISQNTMKTHLRNTYRKLDADGRNSAVEKAKKLLLI